MSDVRNVEVGPLKRMLCLPFPGERFGQRDHTGLAGAVDDLAAISYVRLREGRKHLVSYVTTKWRGRTWLSTT
jgi:hypothetical protein